MNQATTQAIEARAIKYLTAANLTTLAQLVNDHLKNGWMLHGAVQVLSGEFIQTMVKTKNLSP